VTPTTHEIKLKMAQGIPLEVALLDAWAVDPLDRQAALQGTTIELSPEAEREMRAGWEQWLDRAREDVRNRDWEGALAKLDRAPQLGLFADWWQLGCLTPDEFRALLPGVWSGAEPDDTDPLWLKLWTEAAKSGRVEQEPMPEGDPLTIYRGEPEVPKSKTRGIAWSLERDVAKFFALRRPWSDGTGVVLETTVPRDAVLGYVTDRQEAEIIVTPKHVKVTAIHAVTEADRPERKQP
jgi:hypothetical protein